MRQKRFQCSDLVTFGATVCVKNILCFDMFCNGWKLTTLTT